MKKFVWSIAVTATLAAMMYGCGNEGNSPADPQFTSSATTSQQIDCGDIGYLSHLSPVLPVWKDSLEAWLGNTALLDDTPQWTDTSTPVGYLNDLVPVLQQWQPAINGALASALLDSVADFDPSGSTGDYITGLSSLLVAWKDSLETERGATFLAPLPVYTRDATAPVVREVAASPNLLWPPNHKWVDVRIVVDAVDECSGGTSCEILDVTSNEPINGTGDGNTEPDWLVTGGNTLKLRAERSGNLTGRVYYVHGRCADDAGNATEFTVEVTVPHDQSGK